MVYTTRGAFLQCPFSVEYFSDLTEAFWLELITGFERVFSLYQGCKDRREIAAKLSMQVLLNEGNRFFEAHAENMRKFLMKAFFCFNKDVFVRGTAFLPLLFT